MIDTYIKKIASITKRGDAREESYYPAFAELLEWFSETKREKKAHVTALPKKTQAGNPDFRVWTQENIFCWDVPLPNLTSWLGLTQKQHLRVWI
jgi:hypothetical protein